MTDDSRTRSLWAGTTPETAYPQLAGKVNADVCVVGGGITGLTAAYLLQEAGVSVAVVEARRIATGTTGNTTAKITSLHGLVYAKLLDDLGDERARLYGEANQAAIEQIATVVAKNGIACDFERMSAYTYAESEGLEADVAAEVHAASRLGLPAAYDIDVPLPFPVRAAVRFDGQALFHPRKYCLALAELIVGRGGQVFEESRAQHVDRADGRHEVRTPEGSVSADQVLIATLLPFHDPAGLFARTHASRSYALASRIVDASAVPVPEGMFLSADSPTRSVRPHRSDGQTYLVIEGEEHKTGQDPESTVHQERIEAWARERFGIDRVDFRWSAQDYMPADGVPYIGRYVPGNDALLTATGFKKWGMTNGTVAAMIVRDLVLGRANPWADVFDAMRLRPTLSAGSFIRENLDVAKQFFKGRLQATPELTSLEPGQGAVVDDAGERVAVYRDEAGGYHGLSARCTHMGCLVAFNPAERTWDCPCHGSRFDAAGKVIEGPAVRDLEPRSLEGEEDAADAATDETLLT